MQPDSVIESRNIWKIFGPRAEEAASAIKVHGLSQDEVAARTACPVHTRVISSDETFERGALNQPLPWSSVSLAPSGKPTLVNVVIDENAGTESGRIGNLNPQSVVAKKA